MNEPTTLQEAIIYFADPDNCLKYFAARRWPAGDVVCPTCGRADVKFLANQRKWQCKSVHPKRQFSVKVGTIFEDSPLGLDKWLTATWMICGDKNGISSYEIARAIGVTQKSAWFMLHRIRTAMKTGSFMKKMGGPGSEAEVDETFIGGKGKFMHKSRKLRIQQIRNAMPNWKATDNHPGKTAVMGILDRSGTHSKVRASVVPNVKRKTLQDAVIANVEPGTALYTDQAVAYDKLAEIYLHETVNHMEEYVRGRVHTNGLENFWCLLKRTIGGTYVGVEPEHLERYLDEQVFRFNNRGGKKKENRITDAQRFNMVLSQVTGNRLTWAELTGKDGERTPL